MKKLKRFFRNWTEMDSTFAVLVFIIIMLFVTIIRANNKITRLVDERTELYSALRDFKKIGIERNCNMPSGLVIIDTVWVNPGGVIPMYVKECPSPFNS